MNIRNIINVIFLYTPLHLQAQYVTSKNLLGAMVWSIETDDFHGTCSGTKFILIKSIYESMNGPIVTPTPGTGTPSTSTPRTTLPTGCVTPQYLNKQFQK